MKIVPYAAFLWSFFLIVTVDVAARQFTRVMGFHMVGAILFQAPINTANLLYLFWSLRTLIRDASQNADKRS